MAVEVLGKKIGHESASADLSSHQFKCIVFGSSGVALASSGGKCDGILQDKPLAGQACEVAIDGMSKVVASAALAKGVNVAVGTSGKIKAAASGDYILGTLMEASSADGDIVSVLMTRPGRLA